MKSKLLLNNQWSFWMLLLGVLFFSCENEELGLRADQNEGDPAPLSASFTTSSMFLDVSTTNTSTNGRTYAWDFGVEGTDDDTSIEFEPSYTYEIDGTYTITLTSKGEGGQEQIVTQDVTVEREMINPSASFTSAIDFLDVAFTNTSANGVSYDWDFGDGTGTSTEENPSYSYATEGTYTVSLTATSATDDTDTITEMITVESRPVAPEADFTFVATDLNVQFTDASLANDGNITAYAWDFGDGTGTSTMTSPNYIYGSAGTYQVGLTITFEDVLGETSSSITQSVSVTSDPGLQATFAAVLQNGDMQTYPTAEQNNNNLVDAWTIDPDNTFNDGSDTPFNFWRNDDLEAFVTAIGGTDKASSSGTDATSAGGTSDRSYKMDSAGERAYQPFEVETGVLYSISAFVKSETTPIGDVEGTFYIFSSEPADETDLASVALATVPVTSNGINEWQQISFSFIAGSTFSFPQSRVDESIATGGILNSVNQEFVILYFVPTATVTSDNEVFLTDVVIETPSLN